MSAPTTVAPASSASTRSVLVRIIHWLLTNRKSSFYLLTSTGVFLAIIQSVRKLRQKRKANEENMKDLSTITINKDRHKFDKIFIQRFKSIMKISFPGIYSKETWYFSLLSILLVVRTLLSVKIASLIGTNAQLLVSKQYNEFFLQVLYFTIISIPVSCVNSALHYFSGMLALRIRLNISHYVHERYLDSVSFYKAINLGSGKIEHADQRVTSDVLNFSEAVPEIYCAIFKPTLDVILFTSLLGKSTGWQGPVIMYSYLILCILIKRVIMPSFGKLIAKESELEGRYRTAHAALISDSEEIAFYRGSEKEKTVVNKFLGDIEKHSQYVVYLQSLVKFADEIYLKYFVSIIGYAVLIAPQVFNHNNYRSKSTEELTRESIKSMRYLNTAKEAGLDLVLSGNMIVDLVGYTSRVSQLLEKLDNLKSKDDDVFKEKTTEEFISEDFEDMTEWIDEWTKRCDQRKDDDGPEESTSQVLGGGKIIRGDVLNFQDVDIVSPEGKILVQKLNFTVPHLKNVMVTGPNGCGKSSLFRVIGELWPLHSGILTKPSKCNIVFLPQKPYCCYGTLRDQLIYPHTVEKMRSLGVTDSDLENLLKLVDPRGEILENQTWDTVKNWSTTLSGGMKQRLAMARLFYHRPKYAVLDECTSNVSSEVEDKLYITCQRMKITYFTVAHRPQLKKHHDFELKYAGNGKDWEWIIYDHSK